MQYTSWLKAYKVVVQCMSHKATAHVWSPSWHVRGKKKEAVSQKNCRDHAGMRLRGVLIHEVFRKVLYLTPSERAKFSSGRIYSHVTSDVGDHPTAVLERPRHHLVASAHHRCIVYGCETLPASSMVRSTVCMPRAVILASLHTCAHLPRQTHAVYLVGV